MIVFRTFCRLFVLFFVVASCNCDVSVNFSVPTLKNGYTSTENWYPRGMKELYWLISKFLQSIRLSDNSSISTREFTDALQGSDPVSALLSFGSDHWRVLVEEHWIVLAVTALFLLLGVVCPLLALYLCCCRCCKRREGAYKKWRDGCRMLFLSIFISCMVIAALFGLVASFVVNEQLENGVDQLPPRLHSIVNDVQLFRNNTYAHLSYLLTDNFQELNESVDSTLFQNDRVFKQHLLNISSSLTLNQGIYLDEIRNYLALIKRIKRLKLEIDNEKISLDESRQELLRSLASCTSSDCQAIRSELSQSNFDTYLESLVLDAFNVPSNFDPDGLSKLSSTVNDFNLEIYHKIRAKSSDVHQKMNKISVELLGQLEDIRGRLYSVDFDVAHEHIDTSSQYINNYTDYRYYAFCLVSSIVALVVACIILGLFCGLCGRKPEASFDNDSCNRASGSKFLMTGVFLYCLCGLFLFLFTAVLFVFGSLSQFYVCDSLSDPRPDSGEFSAMGVLLRVYPQLNSSSFQLPRVIANCHRNLTVYHTLDLGKSGQLENLNQSIIAIIDDQVNDASRFIADLDSGLQALNSQLSFLNNFTVDTSSYDSIIKRLNALDFIQAIRLLENFVRDNRELNTDAPRTMINSLNNLSNLVSDLTASLVNLRNFFTGLTERPNLQRDILELKGRLELAQNLLDRKSINRLVANFANDLKQLWIQYFNLVSVSIEEKVGRCGPLSGAYNATSVAFCNSVISPVNGFWASIGWCLILLFLCVFFSLSLAPLYRKSEFLSDTLLNDQRRNVRVKSRRTASSSEFSGVRHRRLSNQLTENGRYSLRAESPPYVAIPPRGRDLALVSLAPSAANTEPKAPTREDLNEGPPGYSDPTGHVEFERPPPYFYPGAAH